MKIKNFIIIMFGSLLLTGCMTTPKKPSMTPLQRQSLQSRESESKKDIVFPSNVKLSKYTVANLSANLSINTKLDAYLRLENLFDENYEEVYGYQPLSFGAYLGIRYKL